MRNIHQHTQLLHIYYHVPAEGLQSQSHLGRIRTVGETEAVFKVPGQAQRPHAHGIKMLQIFPAAIHGSPILHGKHTAHKAAASVMFYIPGAAGRGDKVFMTLHIPVKDPCQQIYVGGIGIQSHGFQMGLRRQENSKKVYVHPSLTHSGQIYLKVRAVQQIGFRPLLLGRPQQGIAVQIDTFHSFLLMCLLTLIIP